MITEPKIEDRNDQHYVGIRTQVTMQELGKLLPPLWCEVYGWLANKDAKPAGAPLWRYRVIDMAASLEIDVGVPGAHFWVSQRTFGECQNVLTVTSTYSRAIAVAGRLRRTRSGTVDSPAWTSYVPQ